MKHKWSGRQTKALKASIRHWERMRDDPTCGEVPFSEDCACCQEFIDDEAPAFHDDCKECPIFQTTGEYYCDNTPFYKAARLFSRTPELFPEAAQKEIDFLNEVLEAGK